MFFPYFLFFFWLYPGLPHSNCMHSHTHSNYVLLEGRVTQHCNCTPCTSLCTPEFTVVVITVIILLPIVSFITKRACTDKRIFSHHHTNSTFSLGEIQGNIHHCHLRQLSKKTFFFSLCCGLWSILLDNLRQLN